MHVLIDKNGHNFLLRNVSDTRFNSFGSKEAKVPKHQLLQIWISCKVVNSTD
ncbi:hypothetical protein KIN20_010820 [Parelaphostrongylus tenuis]|uniref:Uncharacterized protein n=1 Tax=Parelaphostrongylus tenuis TaxID=148309 RepID=A0AAD5MD42_PARTN|nr:hypothetical protein KIN20_010820 [Parelaphostrongylus tenuis]